MDTEQYYLLKIQGLQEELKEIDLELDAIVEIFAGDHPLMGVRFPAFTKYLCYRSTKLKTRHEEINEKIKELETDLAAWKRFQKHGFLITEEQEKFLDKE